MGGKLKEERFQFRTRTSKFPGKVEVPRGIRRVGGFGESEFFQSSQIEGSTELGFVKEPENFNYVYKSRKV